MASGVCCCFCSVLPMPPMAYRRLRYRMMAAGNVDIQASKSLVNRVAGQASCRIDLLPYLICQVLCALSSECSFHATARTRSFDLNSMTKWLWPKEKSVAYMSSTIVNPSTQTVIYGFWIGPDIEDGCGYVKVAIDHIL